MIFVAALAIGMTAPDVVITSPSGRQMPLLSRHERFAALLFGVDSKKDSAVLEQLSVLPVADPPWEIHLFGSGPNDKMSSINQAAMAKFELPAARSMVLVNPAGKVIAVWSDLNLERLSQRVAGDGLPAGSDLGDLLSAVKGEERTDVGFLMLFLSSRGVVDGLYRDRILDAVRAAREAKIGVVAIFSNAGESDEAVHSFFGVQESPLKALLDAGAAFADAAGVLTTPTAVLLDAKGRLAYIGAIDSNSRARSDNRQYLLDSLAAVKIGKSPRISRTLAFGTPIKRFRPDSGGLRAEN